MANNGHSDTHTLITSKIAAINARVSQNEDLIRRAEAAEVPASMDALLHRIEMFGRAKHDEGYYRDGDDLKSLNRERAAADLAEIRAMLAALKAQQPASAGQSYQVAQGGNGGRGFIIKSLQGTTSWVGGGGGGSVGDATYLVEVQGGGKAQVATHKANGNKDLALKYQMQVAAPVDAEGLQRTAQEVADAFVDGMPDLRDGLPPLPEPVGVLHRGEGGEWSFSTGGHLRSLYAQPIGEHKLHTVDQLRRAQREAVAAYVLKCQREARTAVETIRQGAKT